MQPKLIVSICAVLVLALGTTSPAQAASAEDTQTGVGTAVVTPGGDTITCVMTTKVHAGWQVPGYQGAATGSGRISCDAFMEHLLVDGGLYRNGVLVSPYPGDECDIFTPTFCQELFTTNGFIGNMLGTWQSRVDYLMEFPLAYIVVNPGPGCTQLSLNSIICHKRATIRVV